jgi:hypothetical protein
MEAQEKADELVRKFTIGESSKENAKTCVEEILNDLKESFKISKDLHPHAEGLIAGALIFWESVKRKLEVENAELDKFNTQREKDRILFLSLSEKEKYKDYIINSETLTIISNRKLDRFVYTDFKNIWFDNLYAICYPFPFKGDGNGNIETINGWTYKQNNDSYLL